MRAIAASEAAQESDQNGPPGPIRTCIGCRRRASAAELLRVVVAPGADGEASAVPLVPDPRRRARGRGAWVHPVLSCVELAQRRRAFGRALRVTGAIDVAPVLEFVSGISSTTVQPDGKR